MSRSGLFKAAGVIAALTVISKILGFVREASLASVFGATAATDAYLVGQTIPVLVFAAIGAALGTTFIPVYAQVRQDRGQTAAFDMVTTVINAVVLLSLVLIACGELLAVPLARLVAPGFPGQVLNLTADLSRVMFPMILFQALSGLFTGVLQTEGNFAVPAMIGLGFNTIIILTIVTLGPRYGIGAVAFGTVLAVAAQALIQVPALRKTGYRWSPNIDWKDPGLARIARLVIPVLLGASVIQMNTVVDRILASRLSEGSVAALNYASRLTVLVPSIFGTSVIAVMYPTLAKLSAERRWRQFTDSLSEAIRIISFILVPVAVGIAVLRVPVVQLAFQRGAFDAEATRITSWALLFFCVGLVFFPLRELISRAFFAFQDTTAPMITGIAAVGVNVFFNLLLVGPLRQGGLALGTSLAGIYSAGTLFWLLRSRVTKISGGACRGIGVRKIWRSLWRVIVASAIMGVAAWCGYRYLGTSFGQPSLLARSIRLFGAVSVGTVTYLAMSLALQIPEAKMLVTAGRRALAKRWRVGEFQQGSDS